MCWSGYYRTKAQSDFPEKLATPALRALLHAKVTKLSHLSKHTEAKIAELHGMGPKALMQLKAAMRKHKLSFKKK